MGSIQRVGVTILPQFALTELAVLVTMQKKSPSDSWDIPCAWRIGDTRLGSNGWEQTERLHLIGMDITPQSSTTMQGIIQMTLMHLRMITWLAHMPRSRPNCMRSCAISLISHQPAAFNPHLQTTQGQTNRIGTTCSYDDGVMLQYLAPFALGCQTIFGPSDGRCALLAYLMRVIFENR